ncbi:cytochrome b562 [Acinetobacter sp. HR7]|uniref:cytochrome b562 n=1 Tax=Acinetobacter sp. HR7 TaxID=1509403 RepID=UPI000536AF40|nr:cytochrome b562 [Acinetobacter sp. HR7]KGT47170.1 hypothetical protein GW12_17850 [Acinetobacter sp. HR7]
MIKIILLSTVLVTGLAVGSTAIAAEEHQHYSMRDLDQNLKKFRAADDVKEALAALQVMQKSVESYKSHLPAGLQKLKSEDAQVIAYQGLLNDLLKEIQQAEQLVAANQLEEAQNKSMKMDAIKKQGHKAFK